MKKLNYASLTTTIRTILAIIFFFLIYYKINIFKNTFVNIMFYSISIIILFLLDALDGYIARKFKQSTKFGEYYDIIGDRVVENMFLILFCALGYVHIIVPLIFIIRSFYVDGIRYYFLRENKSPFGKNSIHKNKILYFLTSSRIMRGGYATFKVISFIGLTILVFLNTTSPYYIFFSNITTLSLYILTITCILRGIPVFIDGRKLFW